MPLFQKEQVRRMRCEGTSYLKIAVCLGISENTINHCQRNNIGGMNVTLKVEQADTRKEANNYCKNCDKSIEQQPGRKPRKFCSDECRITWWNSHMDMVSQKSIYYSECKGCRKPFDSYVNIDKCCYEASAGWVVVFFSIGSNNSIIFYLGISPS